MSIAEIAITLIQGQFKSRASTTIYTSSDEQDGESIEFTVWDERLGRFGNFQMTISSRLDNPADANKKQALAVQLLESKITPQEFANRANRLAETTAAA